MLFNNLRKENYFIEKDFLELRDSVKELIDVIEKYKDMRKDSDGCIMELKKFLKEINLVLEEKNLTKKELTNLHSLSESYFDSRIDNSIYLYYVYDKKHHKHEDLAFLLEKKHSPKLINRVYDLAVMELDYTKEDEFFNIARKCTYALGYTNTPKAKEKLELLAKNENELIREYAIKQLNRHDFTDKDVEEQD